MESTEIERLKAVFKSKESHLHLKFFALTCNFSHADWRAIQTDNYWKGCDSIVKRLRYKSAELEIQLMKYKLEKVNEYLKSLNLKDEKLPLQ